jgi:predicted dehydrogenase
MAVIETGEATSPCPDDILIIGGGRWARQIVDVVCSLVPPSVGVVLDSRRNADAMTAWAQAHGLGGRIQVSSAWPPTFVSRSTAVIVANAARDHDMAAAWAISSGLPTIVEKPIALTAATARHLTELARDRNVRFAAAHVFLFARYLENFATLVLGGGQVESLLIDWADPVCEERYGERKTYDAGLPVFADVLPHIVSIADGLGYGPPMSCRRVRVRRGGAAVQLELTAGGMLCTVNMERNAERRRRILQASVSGEVLQLDFSKEPGTIDRGNSSKTADSYWDSKMRPVASMLLAFLKWAAGGERDARLDAGPGLQACKLIDQVSEMYREDLMPWLFARLAQPGIVDKDLRYALAERLQADGPLHTAELDRQINAIRARPSLLSAS